MINEERFKSQVKDLLDEQHYAYDPSNWDAASKVLDAEDKRKNRRFFYFLFSGLGLGILMIGYLLSSAPENKTAHKILNIQNTDSLVTASEQKTNYKKSIQKNPAEKSKNYFRKKVQTGNNDKRNAPAIKQIASPLTFKPSAVQVQTMPVKTEGEATISTQGEESEVSTNNSKVNEIIKNNPGSQVLISVDTVDKDNEALETQPLSSTLVEPVLQKKSPGLPVEQPANKTTSKERTDSLVAIKFDTTKTEPVVFKDTTGKHEVMLSQLQDSVMKVVPEPMMQSPAKNNYLYAEAGTYFNAGWNYKSAREGMGLNVYLGLSFVTRLTNKMAFSVGGYYTTLSGLTKGTKEIRSSKVVFGEQTDVITITPASLNYFLIPVKLHYEINAKHSITFGYTAGYLLDVQSKVQTYTEVLNAQIDKKNYTTGGYVEGFQTFNSQVSLGFRRLLYGNLWMNGEVFYGLTDLRNNTFFGIELRERMTGLKISLTYNLLKK